MNAVNITPEFQDWYYNDIRNQHKVEKTYGERAETICNRIDPNLEVVNLYSDVLEKLAFKNNIHLN